MRPRRVVIGRIIRPHGVKGELRVEPITDRSGRFEALTAIWLTRDGKEIGEFAIEHVRPLGKAIGLELRTIDSREAGAALRGALIEAEPLPPESLPEDTYYSFDLVGLEVETEDGASIGTVAEVLPLPANEVLVVKDGATRRLIPFAASAIARVDTERGKIVLTGLPGLLDL